MSSRDVTAAGARPAAPPWAGGLQAVFGEPHFGQLYATRLLSQTADGIFQVALAAYVIFSPEQEPTAAKVAAAFATVLLPYSVVGPFAGVFIDRWSRQRILFIGTLIRVALVVAVAGLVASGLEGVLFYGATLVVISVNRFFLAALSAAIPHVVRSDLLAAGNSLSTTSGTLVAVAGGGIGYLVRSVAGSGNGGVATVMLAAAAGYLASAAVAATMGARLLGPDEDRHRPETRQELRSVVRGVVAGGRHVWARRAAAHALLAITAHRFCYGISTVATLLLYRNYFFHDGSTDAGLGGLALVVVVSGVGYLVAALVTPAAVRMVGTVSWVVALFLLAGVVEIVFGVPYTEPMIVVAAFFLGVVAQGAKIAVDTTVQQATDDAFRGRVFSFYDILFNVAFVGAAAAAAFALPPNGKSYTSLVIIAAGYAGTGLMYGWRSRALARRRP